VGRLLRLGSGSRGAPAKGLPVSTHDVEPKECTLYVSAKSLVCVVERVRWEMSHVEAGPATVSATGTQSGGGCGSLHASMQANRRIRHDITHHTRGLARVPADGN
jgi:hypothetical protein